MKFVRSNFGTNEPLPVEHSLDSLLRTHSKKWGKMFSTGRGSFVPNFILTKSIFYGYTLFRPYNPMYRNSNPIFVLPIKIGMKKNKLAEIFSIVLTDQLSA